MPRRRANPEALDALLDGPSEVDLLRSERDELLARLARSKGAQSRELTEARATIRQLAHELELSEARHDFLDSIREDNPTFAPPVRPKSKKRDEAAIVILASDWHYGEVVEPDTVSGLNAFDLKEAERRVGLFWSRIPARIEAIRKDGAEVTTVVLWMGGDLMTGRLHDYKTSMPPTSEARALRGIFRDGIKWMLDECQIKQMVIPCSYGNHGRTSERKKISVGAENSFEWMIYKDLEDEFRGESRVRFEVSDGDLLYLDVFDRTIRFHHGDAIRGGNGIGGLAPPMMRAHARWNASKRADLTCVGHFHQLCDFGAVMVNGSIKGYDAYAQHMGFSSEPPQQWLFSVMKDRDVWRRHRMPIVCS